MKLAVKHNVTEKQLRGSSLLLAGKFLAVGINFASQVLMVRYLSTTDYGALAYALAVVAFFHHLSTLGLQSSVPRFVPIYHERHEYEKLSGTIALTLGATAIAGLVIIGLIYLAPEQIARLINDHEHPIDLLLIMILVVPIEALDALLIGLFASFASPRAIFIRKYILGPCFRFTVVFLMVVLNARVVFMAYGYLAASACGVLIYIGVLIRVLRQKGILQALWGRKIVLPMRELFTYCMPMLATDVLVGFTPFAATLLLGYFHDANQVAMFRVVLPLAHLNRIVKMSFQTLYTPAAARLFAKHDYKGLKDLYWRTALWMSILSFPIFVVTFSSAKSMTILIYGARYEPSWMVLMCFSLAYYFAAVSGFNALTLQIIGKMRYVVTIHVMATIITIAANLLLIPRYGALGAVIGTGSVMILHNLCKHLGLLLVPGMKIFEKKYLSVYAIIIGLLIFSFIFQFMPFDTTYLTLGMAIISSFFMLKVGGKILKITEIFPEIMKIPLFRVILK